MGQGKALAIAAIGAGAAAAFAFGGSANAAESEEPKKKAPKMNTAAKVGRVTLSAKYAKAFGVPTSLVLATTFAQSGNKRDAHIDNHRGGSWGYGQLTLDTAKEIWPKAKAKIGKEWDGTGQGLLDPAINLGLTAAYLATWWNRYKKNAAGWGLTVYAYTLGPGRVRQFLPKDLGKLPKPLPDDVATVKRRYTTALAAPEVKKAIAQEKASPKLAGSSTQGAEPLSGKALANTIPATVTGYQARSMFGIMTQKLQGAYATLKAYDPTGLAKASRIDAGSIDAARQYLDSTNSMLGKYYAQMPNTGDKLTADQLKKLKVAVSTSSVAVKTVDDLFGTGFWRELGGEIVEAAKTVAKAVNNAVGFSFGMIAAAAVGVGFLVLVVKK
jgi:hypothetical protein